jgi:hypothetical protein
MVDDGANGEPEGRDPPRQSLEQGFKVIDTTEFVWIRNRDMWIDLRGHRRIPGLTQLVDRACSGRRHKHRGMGEPELAAGYAAQRGFDDAADHPVVSPAILIEYSEVLGADPPRIDCSPTARRGESRSPSTSTTKSNSRYSFVSPWSSACQSKTYRKKGSR